jgi:hypothetical protein
VTLDENFPRREHRALIDHYGPFPPQDPEFVRIANAQSAEAAAVAAEERRVQDECDSPGAEESRWFGVGGEGGIFRRMPWHMRNTRYAGDAG